MDTATDSTGLQMELLEQVAAALRVLAHPHRLKMVELLMHQRLSVGELAEALDLPQAAVSQHLSNMRAHGLLACESEGRARYYRVVHPSARNVIQCIYTHHGPDGDPAGTDTE